MPRARNRLTIRPRRTTRLSPLSHGNLIEERTAIYLAVGSEYQNVSLIREFKALIPPIFQGGPNFLEAENLMKEIKKILDVMVVPEEMRLSLVSFMFKDEADNWWDMIRTTQDVTQMRSLEDKKELNLYTWFKGT
ncbi:hypothetical protein PVL29_022946 [Vitis rotundifolia]|uniref:Uncharacterized protein n=1 Tax=Vitis rotundifolia TaxID=103349 RepID=A0AA38YX99_VITRO|nr:hypothetical protein PVL29_022946 [Vitis rotundifolia]